MVFYQKVLEATARDSHSKALRDSPRLHEPRPAKSIHSSFESCLDLPEAFCTDFGSPAEAAAKHRPSPFGRIANQFRSLATTPTPSSAARC